MTSRARGVSDRAEHVPAGLCLHDRGDLQAAAVRVEPSSRVTIPLCVGLTIVTAIDLPEGDYRSINTIESITDKAIALKVSAQRPLKGVIRNVTVRRTILPGDLRTAAIYMRNFDNRAPLTMPGTTALGTSAAVLRALKTTGAADLSIVDAAMSAAPADRTKHPNIFDALLTYRLQRAGTQPATLSVTVNGAKVELPAKSAHKAFDRRQGRALLSRRRAECDRAEVCVRRWGHADLGG